MKFVSITFKNFLSFGNKAVTIPLHNISLDLICGVNGAGKSTIMEAIYFALSGKTIRKLKKSKIINSTNKKGTLVTLEVESNKDKIVVKRGISPNVFEIYVNDTMLSQNASVHDYQSQLEQLLMSPWIFQKTVMMSTKNYIPFLQMGTAEKRSFIEEILGLQIFAIMSKNLKVRQSVIQNEIRDQETIFEKAEEAIEIIELANKKANEQNDELISEYKEKIILLKDKKTRVEIDKNNIIKNNEKITQKLKDAKKKYEPYYTKEKEIIESMNSFELNGLDNLQAEFNAIYEKIIKPFKYDEKERWDIEYKIKTLNLDFDKLKKENDFYKNNEICPICKQKLNGEEIKKNVKELKSKGKKLKKEIKLLEDMIVKFNNKDKKIADIKEFFDKMRNYIFTQTDLTIKDYESYKPLLKKEFKEFRKELLILKKMEIELNEEYEKNAEILHKADKILDNFCTIIKENDEQILLKDQKIESIQEMIDDNNDNITKLKKKSKTKLQSTKEQEKKLNNSIKKKKKLEETELHLKIVKKILADDGIKQFILKKYIPILTDYVNKYLDLLTTNYRICLDENLDIDIIAKGYENLDYENFSEGEKQRLDLSLLFSFLELAKLKNSVSSNLLFLDEVLDSSLDEEGFEGVFSVFEYLKSQNYNVKVISHKKNISTRFDNVFNITKIGKFSHLEEL